jgi:uncharacterized membrane protein
MKKLRPVVKGLSWRAFAAFDTMFVAAVVMYWQTGHVSSAVFATVFGIVGCELATKTFLFAIHEKLWERGSKAITATPTIQPFQFEHAAAQVARMDREYAAARSSFAVE